MMRVVIVTQNDVFYLPLFLEYVLRRTQGIIGIIILPRRTGKLGWYFSAMEFLGAFGLSSAISYGKLYLKYKAMDIISVWKERERFYSVKQGS